MISLKNLKHIYPSNFNIQFQDFDFKAGENYLVLGDSGSGKSTLLHILTGLLKPTEGQVFIKNQDLYLLKGNLLDKFRAQNIGIVFQKPHFINSLTVYQNLVITQTFAGLKENKNRIIDVLSQLAIEEKIDNYPSDLSIGQLQRLSIARAVLNSPQIIFADEPTSSLDDINTEKVLELLISQANKESACLIVATHDKRVKSKIANTYLVKNNS